MAAFDQRLIDPAPDAIVSLLLRATRAANGRMSHRRVEKDRDSWARFVKRAAKTPEGCQTFRGTRSGTWGSALVRAAWWTDPVGRRHWRVVGRRVDYVDYRLRDVAFLSFPLWFVYPDRLMLHQKGESAELIGRCDCGVSGPVGRIAWMGECCGPCHDRAFEGVAVRPAEPLRLSGKWLCTGLLTFAGPDVLVSAGCGRVVRWDLAGGGEEALLYKRGGHVYALAAAPSGLVAASPGYNRVLILRPGSSDWVQINPRCGQVSGMAISPDGRWLAVSGASVCLVDLASADLTARTVATDQSVGPLCFAADGRTLWVLDVNTQLHRIDVASGRADVVRTRPESGPNDVGDYFLSMAYYPYPRAMACSHDGRWLAVVASWGGWFGTHLGDLATGRWFSLPMPTPAPCSQALCFTTDGTLVSFDNDGAVRLWDVARQRLREALLPAPGSLPGLQAPAFSAEGERVALGGTDGTIRMVPWRAMLGD